MTPGTSDPTRRRPKSLTWPAVALAGAFAFGVLSLGCGGNPLNPSDVQGDWSGRDAPAHFAAIDIRFELRGSAIEGRACRLDGPHLSFDDAPVTLNGRRVTIRVTEPTGIVSTFEGEFNSDATQITGAWTNTRTMITFTRGGDYCSFARQVGFVIATLTVFNQGTARAANRSGVRSAAPVAR